MTEGERIKQVRTSPKINLTLEKFGEKIGVTKAAMSNIEKSKRNVTDQVRKAVCREFHVNEEWLRTGEGEMQASLTREQEIAEIVAALYKEEDESFRFRLVKAICAMDVKELELWEKRMRDLV